MVVLATGLLLSVAATRPARAQGGDISVVDHTATIHVSTGDRTIREGPPSRQDGGWVYRCGYFHEGHGQWHTNVRHWSELIEGEHYYLHCARVDGGVGVVTRWIVWNPLDPSDGEGVSSIEIRDWIGQNLLRVEAVPPALSPAAEQITGVDTWFWPGASTATQRRQASAGPLSVVVEARFESMEFDPGEPGAERFICDRFVEWAPGRNESPCAHTYLHQSSAEGFELESRTNWQFWWQDVGLTGFELYATSSPTTTQPVVVLDLEAVISSRRD